MFNIVVFIEYTSVAMSKTLNLCVYCNKTFKYMLDHIYIYIYIYIYMYLYKIKEICKIRDQMSGYKVRVVSDLLVGWLVMFLWHINSCRLFNAKSSLYTYIKCI